MLVLNVPFIYFNPLASNLDDFLFLGSPCTQFPRRHFELDVIEGCQMLASLLF